MFVQQLGRRESFGLKPPRLAHGEAVSAARRVGRSPIPRSHGQKRPHGQKSEPTHRRPSTGTRYLPAAARGGETSGLPLHCFQFSSQPAFAQAPWPRRQGNPRERPRPSRRHGRPQRTPRAQPLRPDVACGVPNACPRSPRAAEQSASPPQPRLTDGRLGLLALRLPEQPPALPMLKNHASRRSKSRSHNLGLPEPCRPAAPDPGAI